MAKTQPAKEAKTQPDTAGETDKQNRLEKIAAKLLDGREQAGYTLVPTKKLKGNHTVEDNRSHNAA